MSTKVASSYKVPAWERRLVGRFVRTAFRWTRRARQRPLLTSLPWKPIHFEGNSGADIAGRWFPASTPRGTVVLAHPDRRIGQTFFLTRGWIEFLQDHHLNALTFDFAPYGESRGGSTYLFEDALAACVTAVQLAPRLPLHLVGVSIGAFSAANAAPHIDGLESLILESPFPTFNAWYGRGWGRIAMSAFDSLFPRTANLIQADENLRRATAKRILIAASRDDKVTPVELTRRMAHAAPAERTVYLEVDGVAHLELFEGSPEFREHILATILGEPAPDARTIQAPVAVEAPI